MSIQFWSRLGGGVAPIRGSHVAYEQWFATNLRCAPRLLWRCCKPFRYLHFL
jgi:hypothetical protein